MSISRQKLRTLTLLIVKKTNRSPFVEANQVERFRYDFKVIIAGAIDGSGSTKGA